MRVLREWIHRIFLFAWLASTVAGVLGGLAPALQAGRRPLASSAAGRLTAGVTTVRFRRVLVGAQLAVTLVLLVGAGLFVQTLTRLQARDHGFDGSSLLMFRADPAGTGHPPSDAPRVIRSLLRTLQELPAVEQVALANNALLGSGGPSRNLIIESDERLVAELVPAMRVSEGLFATVGVRVIAGREFDEGARATSRRPAFAR
jgi:hypothetical protein